VKREPSTPSAKDLRSLSEHLFYEVQMTFGLATYLVSTPGTVTNLVTRNAEIEAFTIHVRQLIDFLWKDRPEGSASTDAYAADYFAPGEWAKLRPERPAILNNALRRKVGWGVAHLTYDRARSTFDDKQWNPVALAGALAPAVICFADTVEPSKLAAEHLELFKPYAQSVLSLMPTSPDSTSTTAST
jgi:hypothetical protein